MKYLYLDNFRGFQNQSVPLLDVNFLVGENSTGKTSLATMLSEFHPEYFLRPDGVGFEGLKLGHFAEMVSAHSKDQSYFRLGFVGETRRGKDQTAGEAILITYKKVDGIPQIAKITCTTPKGETSLEFGERNKLWYRNVELEPPTDAKEMHKRLLAWADEHANSRSGSGWAELESGLVSYGKASLPFLLSTANATKDGNVTFFMPPMTPPIVWIAPIRSRPRRTYDETQKTFSIEGDHIPYVIKKLLSSQTDSERFEEFIRAIGSSSGLFQRIAVKQWGRTETSPFEVDAYLDNKGLALNALGYGVSQSLPIFVELFEKSRGTWFSIQQPEVHLHPRAQAALGDLFFQMASKDNKKFIIETHSDFMIDRFRLNYRNSGNKSPKSQILFFQRKDKHNIITPIHIEANGELSSDQPDAYRQFFIREELNMLSIR